MVDSLKNLPAPVSPLDGCSYGTADPTQLVMRPSADCMRWSLRIKTSELAFASKAFGLAIAPSIGAMVSFKQRHALCLGPDEWMLFAGREDAEAIQSSFVSGGGSIHYSLVDVSHRSVGIDIVGTKVHDILSAGCPLDLDNFPSETCTRTIFDKAQIVMIKYSGTQYRLEIARSYAPYVWDFLVTVAGEERI